MIPYYRMQKTLKYKLMRLLIPAILAILFGFINGCQQSSDDASVANSSSTTTDPTSDTTAPTTTISVSSFCTLTGLTVNACTNAPPITVTFTVDETATVYYAQGTTPGVTVNSDSDSVASGGSISVSGTEGATIYVAFFAQDSAGNAESSRELTIAIPDLTDPVTDISFVVTADSSSCQQDSPMEYTCEGPITVTITYTDNTTTTIYYDLTTDTASTPTTGSTQYTAPFTISANDSYLSFFAQDSASNTEAVQTYYFQIEGLTPSINGGYYPNDQSFTLSKSANRTIPTTEGDYQIYYLARTGTDVSTDSTADADSVFTSADPPTVNPNATRYYNSYPLFNNETPGNIDATSSSGETAIYQYKYNLVYDGTQDATGDVINGVVDKENSLVLYIDRDTPKAVAVPPSSGSLGSTINITTYFQDNGHDKIDAYAATNPNLATATPLQSPTASYCKSTEETNYFIEDDNQTFWEYCQNTDNKLGLTSGNTVSLTADTLVGLSGQDAAGNKISCDTSTYRQFTCQNSTPAGNRHFLELYTPGMLRTSYYHDYKATDSDSYLNFGHAIAIGDLDGDGTSDSIAIGAPAYSYTNAAALDVNKGAVYVWYNGLRERAIKSFIANTVTTDVSSRYMDFQTDTRDPLRIYLDPSDDTSSSPSDFYQAAAGVYSDKTQATAAEIATVLNKAFLSSYGKGYQNYLYADASTDSRLSVGHVNRTIQGYFTYSSNFDPTSDFYYSGNAIRAYDYVIYGENDNDDFGFSIAFGQVDTSTDTSQYSASQLVAGAPGYDNDNGAVYVIRLPATDASADYGSVTLADSTDDAYKIHATTGSGRLGHAITLYDNNSDSYLDIYTSAPFYSALHSNGGAVYKINQQSFTYSNASNNINDVSSDGFIWNTVENDNVDAADSLFGYSLVTGYAKNPPYVSSKRYLFIGVPGNYGSINQDGKVAAFFIQSGAALMQNQSPSIYEESDDTDRSHFGFSLAIVDSGFDTSGTGYCPCLVVGAPGENNDSGGIWILGGFSYSKKLSGTSGSDRLGMNLLAGKIGTSDTFDTLFITARSEEDKGHIVIVRKQALAIGSSIVTETLNPDLTGTEEGDHLGHGLGILTVNGIKGLVTGLAGDCGDTSCTSVDHYLFGGNFYQKGSVRIYSGARLGY